MRFLTCLGLLVVLAGCTPARPVPDDSRAGLLRPVSGSGTAGAGTSAAPAGRKTHGHLYMGSGFGGNHV